jgi:hypothetical protein
MMRELVTTDETHVRVFHSGFPGGLTTRLATVAVDQRAGQTRRSHGERSASGRRIGFGQLCRACKRALLRFSAHGRGGPGRHTTTAAGPKRRLSEAMIKMAGIDVILLLCRALPAGRSAATGKSLVHWRPQPVTCRAVRCPETVWMRHELVLESPHPHGEAQGVYVLAGEPHEREELDQR